MGLRKLLSTNTTTTTTAEEKKVSRKSASSISLSKSISNWAGKEKEKLRQHSLNSKRHSQPSPTHSNGSIHSHHGRKTTNPFETTEPVTPTSGSLRDVNDVVTKRTSDSFMEDQQSWSEDMHHHQTTEDEDDYVSSPMTYDSNKHEVASFDSANDRKEREIYAELETVALQLQTINPENAVETKKRMRQVNELLTVAMERSQVLEEKIQRVMTQSKQIIEASVEENRELKKNLKLQIENEENSHLILLKELHEQQGKVQAEKELLEQEKSQLVQENKRMEGVLVELKEKEKAFLQKEREELKVLEEREQVALEKLKLREQELEMLKVREEEEKEEHEGVLSQLQKTKEADTLREQEEKVRLIKEHEERYQMIVDRLEETKLALEKKEKEISLTKEKIYMLFNQEISNDDELIDGIKEMMIRIEGLEQEAERKKEEANQREQEYNAALRQEKIKLEDGTREIRDLLDKEHDRFVGQMKKENEALKIKLTELEEQHQARATTTSTSTDKVVAFEETTTTTNEMIQLKERIKQLEKEKDCLQQSPEDMVQLHAKAQLGLIEYLEGEDDVIQAITKFKKQLETNLKEFNSTNPNLDKHR